MNIFIYQILEFNTQRKNLFILSRPFYLDQKWGNFEEAKITFEINDDFKYVSDINLADVVLISDPINIYFSTHKKQLLRELSLEIKKLKINAYGFIEGDFGVAFPEFSNIFYFRMGGFKKQLSDKNKGFPVSLSDHFQRLFHKKTIIPSAKKELPIVGFCGHASLSNIKRGKEIAKCVLENSKRFIKNPFRTDYEPLFASAFQRACLLKLFERAQNINCNFIYRENYRAGAKTEQSLEQTTKEYYKNIKNSDYIICLRGAGNFSVRFYETLMMGKIPIFVNTDCLLPFDDKINWKKHVVWVEWHERKHIAKIVANFHSNISNEAFIRMQIDNRNLWKNTLSINTMLEIIKNDI